MADHFLLPLLLLYLICIDEGNKKVSFCYFLCIFLRKGRETGNFTLIFRSYSCSVLCLWPLNHGNLFRSSSSSKAGTQNEGTKSMSILVCTQFKLLLYNILTLMFNSHYIPDKFILEQAAIVVSHSLLLQAIFKQAAIIVSQSHLLLSLAQTILPFVLIFCGPNLYIKCHPFINKQFSIDSFLDWEDHHWVLTSRIHTTASDSLIAATM